MNKSRAIVIGGGLGGLAVALRLAARNWNVTVFEKGNSLGGKMNRWATDGFKFDTGPSLLTMPQVFEELFEAAGTHINDHIRLQAVNPLVSYVFDDGVRFRLSTSLPDWLKTVRRLADDPGGSRHPTGARDFAPNRNRPFSRQGERW